MREIKLKAWHPDVKQMSEVVTIQHLVAMDHAWDLTNVIWLQWTGLKDRNGKEICEGDIVEVFGEASQVMYSEANAGFRYQRIKSPYTVEALGNYSAPAFLVIGNIYENPELLEGEE